MDSWETDLLFDYGGSHSWSESTKEISVLPWSQVICLVYMFTCWTWQSTKGFFFYTFYPESIQVSIILL